MAGFLYGYTKIISGDESKQLYSGKLSLIDIEDPYNLQNPIPNPIPQNWVQQKHGTSSVASQIGQCDQSATHSLQPRPTWASNVADMKIWPFYMQVRFETRAIETATFDR